MYFKINVEGLNGGHSGGDIHLGRANANKLLPASFSCFQASMRLWFLKSTAAICATPFRVPHMQ